MVQKNVLRLELGSNPSLGHMTLNNFVIDILVKFILPAVDIYIYISR